MLFTPLIVSLGYLCSGRFLYNQNPFNLLCSQRMFHLALFNSARGTTCCLNIIILHLIEFGSLFDIQKDSCKSLLFRGRVASEKTMETSDWRSQKLKFRPREEKLSRICVVVCYWGQL